MNRTAIAKCFIPMVGAVALAGSTLAWAGGTIQLTKIAFNLYSDDSSGALYQTVKCDVQARSESASVNFITLQFSGGRECNIRSQYHPGTPPAGTYRMKVHSAGSGLFEAKDNEMYIRTDDCEMVVSDEAAQLVVPASGQPQFTVWKRGVEKQCTVEAVLLKKK